VTTENPTVGHPFWQDALAWRGAITPRVFTRVAGFSAYAGVVAVLHRSLQWRPVESSHLQYTAGVLVLLLVLRTNAGYERWWEARKLWGGIVNQSRNLAIKGLAYGPADPGWQDQFRRWAALFCHAARMSLRGEDRSPAVGRLVGAEDAERVAAANHAPSYVAIRLGEMLRAARDHHQMDGFAFLELDRERALLIDHVGACERILRTPLPRVHSIKLRRFILLYMLGMPFALGSSSLWLMPIVTGLVAYPLFAIDQIGQELENPFSLHRESHLPLDRICNTIETNLMALAPGQGASPDAPATPP
jgi:ion channel-forming bestrophin family protein